MAESWNLVCELGFIWNFSLQSFRLLHPPVIFCLKGKTLRMIFPIPFGSSYPKYSERTLSKQSHGALGFNNYYPRSSFITTIALFSTGTQIFWTHSCLWVYQRGSIIKNFTHSLNFELILSNLMIIFWWQFETAVVKSKKFNLIANFFNQLIVHFSCTLLEQSINCSSTKFCPKCAKQRIRKERCMSHAMRFFNATFTTTK